MSLDSRVRGNDEISYVPVIPAKAGIQKISIQIHLAQLIEQIRIFFMPNTWNNGMLEQWNIDFERKQFIY